MICLARLAAQATNDTGRVAWPLEALLWLSAFGTWLASSLVVNSIFASLVLASASIRLGGIPMKRWDGFRTALWGTTGSMLVLSSLPFMRAVGFADQVFVPMILMATAAVALVFYYGLPRFEIEASLRGALPRDEFTLHDQPILNAETREIVAAEALIRWRDAERGMIPPDEFVPVAEETGLIVPLGPWTAAERRC